MPAKAFISYSHADDAYRARLGQHMAPSMRSGLISVWHDRRLGPGEDWNGVIHERLAEADIILCLLSCAFFASDYCWCDEMKIALDRHAAGTAVLIPIVCRPCDWEFLRLGKLQALPPNGLAISCWSNRDKAFESIARAIRHLLGGPPAPTTTERRITIRIVLDAKDQDALARLSQAEVVASMQSHLRKATHDDHLEIRAVSSGSVVVDLDCSENVYGTLHFAARHGSLFKAYGCSIRDVTCQMPDQTPYWYRSHLGGVYSGHGDESEGAGTMYCARDSFAGLELLAAVGRSLLPTNVATVEDCTVFVTRRGRMFYAQANLELEGSQSAQKILTNAVHGLGDMLCHLCFAQTIDEAQRAIAAHRISVHYLVDRELAPLVNDGRLNLQDAKNVRFIQLDSDDAPASDAA